MTLRKSKIIRGLLLPVRECTPLLMEADSISSLHAHSHKHTCASQDCRLSALINIHEIIIINNTKVILFFLRGGWFLHLVADLL